MLPCSVSDVPGVVGVPNIPCVPVLPGVSSIPGISSVYVTNVLGVPNIPYVPGVQIQIFLCSRVFRGVPSVPHLLCAGTPHPDIYENVLS